MTERLSPALRFFGYNLVALPVASIGAVVVARGLGPSGRGETTVLLSMAAISSNMGLMGVNVAFRALLPKSASSVDQYRAVAYRQVPFAILLGALLAFCAQVETVDWLVLVSLGYLACIVGTQLSLAELDGLKAAGLLSLSGKYDLLGALFSTVALTLLFLYDRNAFTTSSALFCYGAGFALRAILARRTLSTATLSKDFLGDPGDLRRLGRKFAPFGVAQQLVLTGDVLLGAVLVSTTELGIYAAAATIGGVLRLPGFAIAQEVNHLAASGAPRRRILYRAFLATFVTALLALPCIVFAPQLMAFLYGSKFSAGGTVLQLLLMTQIAAAPFLTLSRALAGQSRARAASGITSVGLVVLAAGIIVLAPPFGALGIAGATLINMGTLSVFCFTAIMRSPKEAHS